MKAFALIYFKYFTGGLGNLGTYYQTKWHAENILANLKLFGHSICQFWPKFLVKPFFILLETLIQLSEDNDVWAWGRSLQRLGDFHNFSIKTKYFEANLVLNLCCKTYSNNGWKKSDNRKNWGGMFHIGKIFYPTTITFIWNTLVTLSRRASDYQRN